MPVSVGQVYTRVFFNTLARYLDLREPDGRETLYSRWTSDTEAVLTYEYVTFDTGNLQMRVDYKID